MSLFSKKPPTVAPVINTENPLAEMALSVIHDGVVITDSTGIIKFINPAALQMADCDSAADCLGLDYGVIIKLLDLKGAPLATNENLLQRAIETGQTLDNFRAQLVQGALRGATDKSIPASFSLATDSDNHRIITFRNITKDLAEESDKSDFISTASHEMRTPVATIDGYLSLALNPQTATIDERARAYLTSAEKASKHLGHLFQDLLDVTKLDDGRIRPHLQPVEVVSLIKQITDSYSGAIKNAKLNLIFGSERNSSFSEVRRVEQVVYSFVDVDFFRLIMNNLLENAIKYTPAGGSIYVNVIGDGGRVVITITDTGIGINAEDLAHVFEKFYRADNSDTRTIGGTGLGLYLVRQRAEAMGGSVSAESIVGKGSRFSVILPRLTSDEYEKRMIAQNNGMNITPPTTNTKGVL